MSVLINTFVAKNIFMALDKLKTGVSDILETQGLEHKEKLRLVCELLRNEVNHYDWVGFYFKNKDKAELLLKALLVSQPSTQSFLLAKVSVDKLPYLMKISWLMMLPHKITISLVVSMSNQKLSFRFFSMLKTLAKLILIQISLKLSVKKMKIF